MSEDLLDSSLFADKVALKCYSHYTSALPKRGKPQNCKEWTLLAGFLIIDSSNSKDSDSTFKDQINITPRATSLLLVRKAFYFGQDDPLIVSLATGTKCVSERTLNHQGWLVHDSHAEVLARRGFQRYLYTEIVKAYSSQLEPSTIFSKNADSGKLNIRQHIKFVFFTSQTPCGDASIFARPKGDVHPQAKKRIEYLEQTECKRSKIDTKLTIQSRTSPLEDNSKLIRAQLNKIARSALATNCSKVVASSHKPAHEKCDLEISRDLPDRDQTCSKLTSVTTCVNEATDLYRTGAKCVPGSAQDELQPGLDYHTPGVLRTKPGRGDPTISMSCSDKIMRWNILGWQGALLMHLIEEPIYIDKVVIGGCVFDELAMRRALYNRLEGTDINLTGSKYHLHKPDILYSRLKFCHSREETDKVTSSSRIVPCPSSIIWYKCGTSHHLEIAVNGRKQGITKSAYESPKARLSVSRYEMLRGFLDMTNKVAFPLHVGSCYADIKKSTDYHQIWKKLKSCHPFNLWISKEDKYSNFTVS